MMKLFKYILPAFLTVHTAYAQYAPQAGIAGSTAIIKTSNQFVGWATGCEVSRGWMSIADPSQGKVTAGDDAKATGAPDNGIVSLGDSGIAVLTFASPIYNGPGPDFAVFENGFVNPANPEEAFLELAFVEVSSDGVNFFRFPAVSLVPETPQIPVAGVYTNARLLNNLAGKYAGSYGTPFDLQELAGIAGLDIDHITHVRIVDVIGSTGDHASYDTDNHKINDPYPTPLPGGGFDLDAVGAIYLRGVGVEEQDYKKAVQCYPNPVTDVLTIAGTSAEKISVLITDATGKTLESIIMREPSVAVSFASYSKGIYYLQFSDEKGHKWVEKVTRL